MANVSPRRLHKSRTERVVFGVAGGLAEYLEVDAVIVRVVFVVLGFAGGLGIIAYVALALLMPEAAEGTDSGASAEPSSSVQRNRNIVGVILIGIGAIFLLQQLGLLKWMGWGIAWAVILILIGIALVAGRLRR